VRCLKQQLPEAEIHFLTKEKFHPILKANPYIDHIHTFNDELGPVLETLKAQKFDFVVDLHKNLRSSRVKMSLKRPSGTFNKLNFKKWLLVNFKVNKLPDIHIVDRYFEAVTALTVVNDNRGLDYFIPEEEIFTIDDLPAEYHKGFIAFVIGGMHDTKMFPEERIIESCNQIDMPIILLGGIEDKEKAERIISQSTSEIYNACGRYSINQSAGIIKMASKVLTNDTGLMHIAAAFKKEIHSFWGNTIPQFGMFPYLPDGEGKSIIHEVKGLACRPCSKIGYEKCPKKHFRCMMDIEVGEMLKDINK
jgi:ADP-heptose:LPS heptosyltransferase